MSRHRFLPGDRVRLRAIQRNASGDLPPPVRMYRERRDGTLATNDSIELESYTELEIHALTGPRTWRCRFRLPDVTCAAASLDYLGDVDETDLESVTT